MVRLWGKWQDPRDVGQCLSAAWRSIQRVHADGGFVDLGGMADGRRGTR